MQIILILLLSSLLKVIGSCCSDKQCNTCKWFVPNKIQPEYGRCGLFKEKIYIADQERLICNFAKHCRVNELFCGKEGRMYETISSTLAIEEKIIAFEKQYDELINKCDECENDGYGEVNETPDIEKLNKLDEEIEKFTKEGLELLFKVKKFNKKKIMSTLDKFFYKQQ